MVTKNVRRRGMGAWLVAVLLVLTFIPTIASARQARADAPTVVSLTFDDSTADQYTTAFPLLQAHGMHGTFYTITGYANNFSGYLTRSQLQDMYNAGNEIGAHTVLHPKSLTQLSSDEVAREVCDSRNTLLNWGFPVTTFAYPHSQRDPQVESIVQQCGLNAARYDGDIKSPDGCFTGCPVAESMPPANPYAVRAADSVTSSWTAQDIESVVQQAEDNGGGWSILVFHRICDNVCDLYSTSPATFNAVLDWLQTQNVQVKTMGEVIGGSVQPAANAPEVSPAAPGLNGLTNPSLETDDPYNSGVPNCWTPNSTGSLSASFADSGAAHSGSTGESVTVDSYNSGAARLISRQDLGQCSPSVTPGHPYTFSGWYQSSSPTRLVLWYRDGDGAWHYWTQSPQFAASSTWAQASWPTPAVPAAARGVSFGLDIEGVGTLTTDDYSLIDTSGNPPRVSVVSPAPGGVLSGVASLQVNASSSVGVTRVDYLVNGAVVVSSTVAPFSASWDSTTVGDGPVTVTARATDTAGQSTTSDPVAATVSNAGSRGGNLLANASLESFSGSVPDCWQQQGSGTSSFVWSRSSTAHSGSYAQNLTISSYTSGSRALITSQKAAACAPRVSAGSAYTLGAWYQSDHPVRIVAYYQTADGAWQFWTQSAFFAASPGVWGQAGWTSPVVPAGAVALSFGLSLPSAGSLLTDDYTMTAS